MMNPLTFDLEDWRPLADRWVSGVHTGPSGQIPGQVDRIRRVLDNRRVRATFFCLGATAAAYPKVVRALARDGHEIASHGYSHIPLYRLTPEEFAEDLLRAQEVLAVLAGEPPRGFRAPQFSIIKRTWWAFDILVKHGFRYDSSIFPIRHRRYGVRSFQRGICEVQTPRGSLVEFPLATASWLGMRIPVAGGGYARLLPGWILRRVLGQAARENLVFTTYFHPYEFDINPLALSVSPKSLRQGARCWLFAALQNLGRSFIPQKLEMLLDSAEFGPCLSLLEKSGVIA